MSTSSMQCNKDSEPMDQPQGPMHEAQSTQLLKRAHQTSLTFGHYWCDVDDNNWTSYCHATIIGCLLFLEENFAEKP